MKENIFNFEPSEWFFQFFYDEGINRTHVEDHGLQFQDIHAFFTYGKYLEFKRKDGCFEAIGYLEKGNPTVIKVIYRKLKDTKRMRLYFIITAYDYMLDQDEKINLNEGDEKDEK
ncbi:hypothetical protein LPTSP4_09210 [Leptospira ryugenii]|uniref:Uncharacterized protein n=1 Tax=Leptospira ryugenii TaxID=1917863 RepID=A0A2P2DXP8_9LEPT|nr:hypothetical protein [Leptospira ryugenii]GBF49408.1 hypothetical protein LPTSP4_09210 [Leptospira ryugenii]